MSVLSVVIAVSPRLLGDLACRVLALDGLAVSSLDAGTAAETSYDVALVSPGREHEVRASEVVTVDPDALDLDALRALLSARRPAG